MKLYVVQYLKPADFVAMCELSPPLHIRSDVFPNHKRF
jgi:hypothetical protein